MYSGKLLILVCIYIDAKQEYFKKKIKFGTYSRGPNRSLDPTLTDLIHVMCQKLLLEYNINDQPSL